jgi:hypothetical protein
MNPGKNCAFHSIQGATYYHSTNTNLKPTWADSLAGVPTLANWRQLITDQCIEPRYLPVLAVSTKQGNSQWILHYSRSRSTQPTTSPPQCW